MQFIRLADSTRPELTLELMIRQWKLKKPDIVISIHGGLKNFKLDPHHKEIFFNRGLIKAAKTTHSGAWIITGNTKLEAHACVIEKISGESGYFL